MKFRDFPTVYFFVCPPPVSPPPPPAVRTFGDLSPDRAPVSRPPVSAPTLRKPADIRNTDVYNGDVLLFHCYLLLFISRTVFRLGLMAV